MNRQQSKMAITRETLLGVRLFDGLDADARTNVARHCEGFHYAPGAQILRHGDMTCCVYVILTGRVRASLLSDSGRLLTFQELADGDMFGELSAIDGGPRSVSVEAVTETTTLRIPGSFFNELLASFPELARMVLLRLCALSRALCERTFEARTCSVPEQVRLAISRVILANAARPAGPVTIEDPPTHEEIANLVGTSREQVSRVMSEYARAGVIESSRRTWRVRDICAVRCPAQ